MAVLTLLVVTGIGSRDTASGFGKPSATAVAADPARTGGAVFTAAVRPAFTLPAFPRRTLGGDAVTAPSSSEKSGISGEDSSFSRLAAELAADDECFLPAFAGDLPTWQYGQCHMPT